MRRRTRNQNSAVVASDGYYLEPGHIYFTREAAIVRTVLGSCVSVCMWDKRLKYGGMSHFLYAHTSEPDKSTAKYGNVAVTALARMMDEAGCRRDDIKAQIFGGGRPEEARGEDVGMKNVQAARRVLSRQRIAVASEDVGGTMGRKLIFDIGTGEVAVFKVHKIRQTDWEPQLET